MSKDKTPKTNEAAKADGQTPANKSGEPTFGFPGEGSFPLNGDGREFQGGFDVMPHGGSHLTPPADQIAQLNAGEKIEIGQAENKDKDKEEKENADEQSPESKSADEAEQPDGDAGSQNPDDYSQSNGGNAPAQDGSLLNKLSLSSFGLEDINFNELSPVTIGLGALGAGLIFSGGGSSGPSDTIAPSLDTVDVSTDNQTITIAYDEALSSTGVPEASSFSISQAGSALQVSSITMQGNSVVLQIGSTISEDPIQISYSGTELTDAAGNIAENFAQLIVSDGYIRGAKIYRDLNDNGVADEGELIEGAVSNDKGEVLLEGESLTYNLIIDGGVNTDTGAKNEMALKAPKGFTVINPLTTLVSKIIEDSPSTEPVNIEQSAAKVASSLGLDLKPGETLASYDPVSDSSNNALSNQVVTAKIATVLAVALASANNANSAKAAQETVLKNLVDKIEAGNVVLDTNTVETLLEDQQGNSIVSNEKLDKVIASVSKFDQANSIEDIVEAQAEVIDDVASAAPSIEVDATSDTGVAGDKSTSDTTPSFKVSFETAALDGTAVVVGDLLEVIATSSEGTQTVGSKTLTRADVSKGFVEIDASSLAEGSFGFTAQVTDIAGNKSAASASATLLIDTSNPSFSSSTESNVDENFGANKVVYQTAASDASNLTYSLASGSDAALSIDASSGAVSLSTDPDYETQSSYSFTVVATDGAGNKSEKAVSLAIANLDDTAPTITSAATASAISENSGADQVVYTVTADDSSDVSAGVTFSLAAGSDAALSIDASSGAVSLSTDPDYETQSSYSFTVVATDGAGNKSEKAVSLGITNLDEVAPTITSAATGLVVEDSGTNRPVYTVTTDDSSDISDGVTYRLAKGSDPALSINSDTGVVTLADNPKKDVQDTYIFTVVSEDAAGNSSQLAVTLTVDVAPLITSPLTSSVDENIGANSVVYTAIAEDAGDPNAVITYGLAPNSDAALSIDASSGAVSLSTDPDYETQSSYSFTVTAADEAGNTGQQTVSLGITNLDEVAPTITSSATGDVLGFQSKLYSGSASDSSDISGGITYSLKSNVGDEQLLNVNSSNGEVSLKSGVTNASTKASYDFTLVADDGVNSPAELAVSVDVDPSVSVSGPGVVTQGGIVPVLTSDGNGNLKISLKLDPSVSSNYASGIENVDLTVVYDSDQIGVIGTSDISFPSDVFAASNPADGQFIIGWITNPFNINSNKVAADAALVEFTFPDPNIDAAISIDIKGIIVGNDALSDASYQLGDPVSVSGTSADEVFELAGGNATVLGGGGDDVFVLSSSTGSETSISDFLTGSDILEMASLAIENGYTSAATPGSQAQDQILVKLIDTPNDIAVLVSNSDASLDNSFGAFFDSSSAELTVFIDGDSDANSTNIGSYKITLTGNSAFDLDDLSLVSPVIPA